tara:strand:- start:2887 stop:3387 length:501 start_codon:yes stop_codon:yes gene_type:complete
MNYHPSQPRQSLSDEQRNLMLRLVKKMLGMGKLPSEIKQAIAREFHLSTRSVERYMRRARREMIQHMEMHVKEHRSEAFYFYHQLMNEPKANLLVRLRARERIDKLMGLDLPYSARREEPQVDLTTAQIQGMNDDELESTYEKIMTQDPSVIQIHARPRKPKEKQE